MVQVASKGNAMKLENFEKEYYDEIENSNVSIETLEKFGVTKKTLSKEVYLRGIYGDEIIVDKEQAKVTNGKKSITRLCEEELNLKGEFASIYGSIDNSSFDQNFDLLGIKLDVE